MQGARWAVCLALVIAGLGAATSCARRPIRVDASANGDVAPVRRPVSSRDASLRIVRVALATLAQDVELTSDGTWTLFASDGATPLALTQPGERWVLECDGTRISARRVDSRPVSLRDTLVVARSSEGEGTIRFNGRRYRGELLLRITEGGIMVVNRLPMDAYLRGVVPR